MKDLRHVLRLPCSLSNGPFDPPQAPPATVRGRIVMSKPLSKNRGDKFCVDFTALAKDCRRSLQQCRPHRHSPPVAQFSADTAQSLQPDSELAYFAAMLFPYRGA